MDELEGNVSGEEALAEGGALEGAGEQPAAEGVEGKPDEAAEGQGAEGVPVEDGVEQVLGQSPHDAIAALVEAARKDGKPFQVTSEQLDALPYEAKQLLANLRLKAEADAAAAAAASKAAEERAAKVEAQAKRAALDRASATKWAKDGRFSAMLAEQEKIANAKPVGLEADPLSPEGIRFQVKTEAAKLVHAQMKAFLGAFGEVHEADVQAEAEAARAARVQAATVELQAWVDATPEMHDPDFREAVATAGQRCGTAPETGRPRLPAQRDYLLVKAERDRQANDTTARANLETARRAVRPGSGLGRPAPQRPPPNARPSEVEAFYAQHPDLLNEDIERNAAGVRL